MNLGQIERPIRAFSDGLLAAGVKPPADDLRLLADFLVSFEQQQVSTLAQRGMSARNVPHRLDPGLESPVTEAARHLSSLIRILEAACADATLVEDLGKLVHLLINLADESDTLSTVLDRLREAMRPMPADKLVALFIERLKKDARTEAFEATFAELSASELKREHMVEIASQIYGSVRKGTSRRAALGFIRKPHDAYMSAKRTIETTGGRSAA